MSSIRSFSINSVTSTRPLGGQALFWNWLSWSHGATCLCCPSRWRWSAWIPLLASCTASPTSSVALTSPPPSSAGSSWAARFPHGSLRWCPWALVVGCSSDVQDRSSMVPWRNAIHLDDPLTGFDPGQLSQPLPLAQFPNSRLCGRRGASDPILRSGIFAAPVWSGQSTCLIRQKLSLRVLLFLLRMCYSSRLSLIAFSKIVCLPLSRIFVPSFKLWRTRWPLMQSWPT